MAEQHIDFEHRVAASRFGSVIMPDVAYLAIRKPHSEPSYRELADGDVAAVLADFQNIGDSVEEFAAFVSATERKNRARA